MSEEKMTLAEIESVLANMRKGAERLSDHLRELASVTAEVTTELLSLNERIVALDARKLHLDDDELAGDYEVIHGTYGNKPTGSVVRLEGAEARSLLAHGVVKVHMPTQAERVARAEDDLETAERALREVERGAGPGEHRLAAIVESAGTGEPPVEVQGDVVEGDGTGEKLPPIDNAEQDQIANALGLPHPVPLAEPNQEPLPIDKTGLDESKLPKLDTTTPVDPLASS